MEREKGQVLVRLIVHRFVLNIGRVDFKVTIVSRSTLRLSILLSSSFSSSLWILSKVFTLIKINVIRYDCFSSSINFFPCEERIVEIVFGIFNLSYT